MLLRDWLLIGLTWFGLPSPATATEAVIACSGQAMLGGLVFCEAPAGSTLSVSGSNGEALREVPVAEDGLATIGIRRTEALELLITDKEGWAPKSTISLEKREDPFRTIKGLDCDKVDARTPDQKAHAGRSWVKKQDAFGTFHGGQGARAGLIRPSDGTSS